MCPFDNKLLHALFLEFMKSISKESTFNSFNVEELWRDYIFSFNNEELWRDYIFKKAKWDFVSEQLDMYEPTDEEDYQRTNHLPWEITNDTN